MSFGALLNVDVRSGLQADIPAEQQLYNLWRFLQVISRKMFHVTYLTRCELFTCAPGPKRTCQMQPKRDGQCLGKDNNRFRYSERRKECVCGSHVLAQQLRQCLIGGFLYSVVLILQRPMQKTDGRFPTDGP